LRGGGRQDIFCPKIMYEKLTKCPNFYDISRKFNKIREFCMIIARKWFFPDFWGHVPPAPPPSTTPMCAGLWRVSFVAKADTNTIRRSWIFCYYLNYCVTFYGSTCVFSFAVYTELIGARNSSLR